ncbi:MAG: putative cytochrome c oxidase subunit [Alphaproteobacteria bacterium]|nr:putative cytochrome c oxidase subunit [Alphaproteobacteria bacterium]
MRRRLLLPIPLFVLVSGCAGIQSVSDDAGRESGLIWSLFVLFGIVTAIFYVAVIAFLIAAYWRRGGSNQDGLPDEGGVTRERSLRTAFFLWTGAVIGSLSLLALASYFTDRGLASVNPENKPMVGIDLVANQWWWDVRYHYDDPSQNIRTANEIHLPAGVPAMISLKSNDVIHSFWVPNLAGKQDLIPGRINDIVLMPRRIGHYRAQCAEYCGLQHAHMALDVIVESPADFQRWEAAQRQPAPAPATPLAQAGYAYVTSRECSTCHNIAGTNANGTVAPDLTHVAGRRTIAAGTLPMNRAGLYAWIADPQGAKPGNNMPTVGLNADELHAVAAYLETLK